MKFLRVRCQPRHSEPTQTQENAVDLLKAIVPGRTYILCVGQATYEGKIIRKSDRTVEMSCDGDLIRLDARQVTVVLEPARRRAVA